MRPRALPILAFAAVALLASGCASSRTLSGTDVNVLGGLVTYENARYTPRQAGSFPLRTSEFTPSKDRSGDHVSLLWGLITFDDY